MKYRVELRMCSVEDRPGAIMRASMLRRVHVCDEVTFDGGWCIVRWAGKRMRSYSSGGIECVDVSEVPDDYAEREPDTDEPQPIPVHPDNCGAIHPNTRVRLPCCAGPSAEAVRIADQIVTSRQPWVSATPTRSQGHGPAMALREFDLSWDAETTSCVIPRCEGKWRYFEFVWRAHGCLIDE